MKVRAVAVHENGGAEVLTLNAITRQALYSDEGVRYLSPGTARTSSDAGLMTRRESVSREVCLPFCRGSRTMRQTTDWVSPDGSSARRTR